MPSGGKRFDDDDGLGVAGGIGGKGVWRRLGVVGTVGLGGDEERGVGLRVVVAEEECGM